MDPSVLARKPLTELKTIASELDMRGYQRMRKADLIDAIVRTANAKADPQQGDRNGQQDEGGSGGRDAAPREAGDTLFDDAGAPGQADEGAGEQPGSGDGEGGGEGGGERARVRTRTRERSTDEGASGETARRDERGGEDEQGGGDRDAGAKDGPGMDSQ